nr:ribonuclease H-like domain-containing protein [Tanacetum cinerariifolium]
MTLVVHNWSSSAHKEPSLFEIQSLAKEADESLDKQKSLELEIKRLLKASVSHDIMSIVQNGFVDVPSDLQSELDHTKEKLEHFIIKRKKNTLFFGIIGTQNIERLQAQLGDLKGKSSDTPSASNTLDPLNQKLETKIVELEFQETSRVDLVPNNQSSASIRTNPITNFQHHVTFKENVSSDMVNSSSTGLVHSVRTRRPQPKGNTRNARVPSASKSSEAKKNVTVEDHRRILSLSKNKKTMSSERNNIKLAIQNDKSEIVCGFPNLSVVRRLGLFQAYDQEHQASHQLCVEILGTVRFGNDHIAAILEYGDLKWGNITITRVYFVKGLGHNLFSVGQFCDADLEVAFRRNTCFIRDLAGVDLHKGNRFTNLYTINLYNIALASPICLMAQATPTKSWLWHQRLSHLTFDTINDLAKNDLRLHMDLCGLMRVASINAPVIIVRTDNETEFKNHALKEYFDSVGITHETSSTKTPQQNGVVERRNRTLVEAARTMLIFSHALMFLCVAAITTACCTQNCSIIHCRFNKTPYELIQGRKPNISYLHVFRALYYPKNDSEDIGKLGAKGDIGFFIRYSANSVAYRVYNRRTKKIIKTMNVTFDELSAMAFEQNSSKPDL